MRARTAAGPAAGTSGPGAVRVRVARRHEAEERARLLRAPAGGLRRAFVHLLLQEVTLQALLLAGAVLFIFCGCGVAQSALVAPAAAAALLLAARLELAAATDRQLQSISEEEVGLVAEGRDSRLVGTVSLRGPRLSALAVAAEWRRRGVGRALAEAAAARAAGAGRALLEAHVSELQPEARALLHRLGWQCLGAYQRPQCGGAVALAVARLALQLRPA